MEFHHVSVLLEEALEGLKLESGKTYVDCTLGGSGHSKEILKRTEPEGRLIAFDQDPAAIRTAQDRLRDYEGRFTLVHKNFVRLEEGLQELGVKNVDGILFDLGVSSHQLDTAERGFSYKYDADLDMRMNPKDSLTAEEIVNKWSEEKLNEIFWVYGEERWSKRVAQFVVQARAEEVIKTTGQLVEVIKKAIPASARKDGPHPAKRIFQALRIAVNDELKAFELALHQAIKLLGPGGRVCVITFHSLEDRICKQIFQEAAKKCICPPQLPICTCNKRKDLKIITGKPIEPSAAEIESNPRARSAKLRIAEKL